MSLWIDDFGKLLDDEELCDATLVASDGATVPVHKLVLATRSRYFKAKFFGNFAADTAKLHFEGGVIKAIKSYCYTDTFETSHLVHLYTHSTEELALKGRFLVQIAAAADYLLLPGLKRQVLLVAYGAMLMSRDQQMVPIIYSQAQSIGGGAEDLKKIAWHIYWMSQQVDDVARRWDVVGYGEIKKIETKVPFEDIDPRADYQGRGMMLLLGGSEDCVNGEYYGLNSEYYGRSFLKNHKHERGGLVMMMDDTAENMVYYNLCPFKNDYVRDNARRTLPATYSAAYESYHATEYLQWEADNGHTTKVGRQTPPIGFHLKVFPQNW